MSTTLEDFFGDGSADNTPECSYCGGQDGELMVSVSDAYGPTHWHHAACLKEAQASKPTPIVPTQDEAILRIPKGMNIDEAAYWLGRANELFASPVNVEFVE